MARAPSNSRTLLVAVCCYAVDGALVQPPSRPPATSRRVALLAGVALCAPRHAHASYALSQGKPAHAIEPAERPPVDRTRPSSAAVPHHTAAAQKSSEQRKKEGWKPVATNDAETLEALQAAIDEKRPRGNADDGLGTSSYTKRSAAARDEDGLNAPTAKLPNAPGGTYDKIPSTSWAASNRRPVGLHAHALCPPHSCCFRG